MDCAAGGIDMSITKYAGPECINYVNITWRRIETMLILIATLYLFCWSFPKCSLPTIPLLDKDRPGKRFLLVLVCLCWGMEIGFKCASRTGIYLLNPCHITTAMQIYLLAAKPSKTVTAVFRIHLNYLNGPILAIVFYETDTRLLPFEATVYWVQHCMMLIVPYYLLRLGGVYNVENITDYNWNVLAYSFLVFYHFTVLQGVSILTNINMNHIMCPLDSDPFRGQLYRTAVFFHEGLLCPLVCKTYILLSQFFLTKFRYTKVKDNLNCDIDLDHIQ
ncbi:transmembrane protein 164 [Sitophilus oryzae]|uniref:Transmembrane protein 164 n=1 Tax=Sitophilus oryzae TaxID=7048 RepID=A0A6J2XAA9_SITOR|nr:transmembrane protein 164 [Sitophilus oryzae]XP_030748102.1 transmembrane protein 164 [Sitophilus oryzae]XP_030748111.1 transmembrane protein 164 [Sitophilus oryzae]